MSERNPPVPKQIHLQDEPSTSSTPAYPTPPLQQQPGPRSPNELPPGPADSEIDKLTRELELVRHVANIVQQVQFIAPIVPLMSELLEVYKEFKGADKKLDMLLANITDISHVLCTTILRMETTNHVDLIGRLRADIETYPGVLTKASKFFKNFDDKNEIVITMYGAYELRSLNLELVSFGARFRANPLVVLAMSQSTNPWKLALKEDLVKWLLLQLDMEQKQTGTDSHQRSADVNETNYGNVLRAASEAGHTEIVRLLLENSTSVNSTGQSLGTALQAASKAGHPEIVRLLLGNGADMNDAGQSLGTALQAASKAGHVEIVQLLLENCPYVNYLGGNGTALQAASEVGHLKIVQLLLENGANVNSVGGSHGTALQAASEAGHPEIVRLLLANGADVNSAGGSHGTALQAALKAGHPEIVRLLLENGADVNSAGESDGTALRAASEAGHLKIVQLLLENGADVNFVGESDGTALRAASEAGHFYIIRLLLDNGADVNFAGGSHGTALRAASEAGHFHIIRLLLDNGADVNSVGGSHGTALQAASEAGHLYTVRFLLENGADVNSTGGSHGTALQAALKAGHLEIVQLLLKNGADMNSAGGSYGTALQAESEAGHTEMVQLLLENGADVNSVGGTHGTALRAASKAGHPEIVRLLILHGADMNSAGGTHGTALQAASEAGHFDVVLLLLKNGADVNFAGGSHGTALQAASEAGHFYIIRLLLENGADVNSVGGSLGTALSAASGVGHLKIVQLLLENGADVNFMSGSHGTALQAALKAGHPEIVRLLLKNSADMNSVGGSHGTALRAASETGHLEIVRLLLENGADVNFAGESLGTALRAASEAGHLKIVQLLLENGADVNFAGESHGTALRAASEAGHFYIIRLLLENGADVNFARGSDGTALRAASEAGHLKIVRLLLENGADVNSAGESDGTALRAASEAGHLKIVRLLLENGADVNSAGESDGTALRAASEAGHLKIVRLLLENGADVNSAGESDGTALRAASEAGHLKIVRLLLENGADVNSAGADAMDLGPTIGFLVADERRALVSSKTTDHEESAATSSDEPQLLTFVIYIPDAGDQFFNDPIAIRLQDVHFLEEHVPEGGHAVSTHASARAVNWVEQHYETDLLDCIRTAGIGGPIATMLSPDTPALALFGSILDDHVLELAKALSDASAFVVMVRPAEDDPLPKFLAAQEMSMDFEMDTESSSESSNDETDSEEGCREQSGDSDVGDSDNGDEYYGVPGAFRPRGGALATDGGSNTGDPDYIVPAGIVRPDGVHFTRLKLRLKLHKNPEPYDVAIISQTAFKFQTAKSETSDMVTEHITRPQVLSCVDLKVEAQPVEVRTERSYSNLGFLVHRPDSIANRHYLPRGFDPPAATATRSTQKSTENTGELLVGVQSLKPVITAKMAHKRTSGQTVQLADNKPPPSCYVEQRFGKEWDEDGKSYSSYDVAWHPMADPNGNPRPVDFRFGMGIQFGGKEERYITKLPTISHILRNQVILWVFDPQLKAKVRGLIVLTSTYIPDIKIAEPLDISDREVVDLALNSSLDPPTLDNAPLPHDAANLVAIALVEQPTDAVHSGIRNTVDRFISRFSGRKAKEPMLIDIPLYEYVSRGWDATNNRWRNTVWPRLDAGFGDADCSSSAAWNLTLPQGLPEDAMDGDDPPAIERLEQGLLPDPTPEQPEEGPALPEGGMDVDPA